MQNFPENQDKNQDNLQDNLENQQNTTNTPPEIPISPFFDEPKKKASWVTSPDVKPEKGYNPYREDFSVFREIYNECPQNFRGSSPLEGETELQYSYRKRAEYTYTKQKTKQKLKDASSFASLLALIFVVIGLAIQIIAVLFISTLTESMTEVQYNDFIDVLNYVLMAIQYIAIFPLIFLVGTVGRKNKCRTFFQKPKTSSMFTFRWCVISLGSTYIISILFDMIFSVLQELGMNVNDLSSELPTEPLELALYGLFTVICAPLFEEIMFRGIMLTHLQKYGCIFASVVSGVFFGLIHQNHAQMFYACALGIIFAIMDIRAGSILPSIIAHVTVNGYSFINTVIAAPTNYNEAVFGEESVALTGPMWALFLMGLLNVLLYISMAAAIVLLIVEIVKFPKTFKLPAGDSMLTSKEKSKAFFSSPVVIITLVLLALVIYMNSFMPLDAISNMISSASEGLANK